MTLGAALRTNTLWMLSGDVSAQLVNLVFGMVLARLLLPEDFGLLVTVQILTGALGFIAANGTSDALVRAKEIGPRDVRTLFAIQLGTCAAIFTFLNLIAPAFAGWFGDPRLAPLLRIASITFLLRPFMAVPSALLHRAMRFKEYSVLIFIGVAVSGLSAILLASLGLGAASLVLGGLSGALARTIVCARWARWVPGLGFDPEAARTLGVYGLKLSANEIVQYARAQTANAIISRQLGAGPVGLYNKADSLAEMPYEILSGSAYYTLFRTLASIQDDRAQCAYLFLRSLTVILLYALPCYVGILWVAEPLILVLYGKPWAAAAVPLQILALVGPLRVIANLSRAVAASHNRLGQEIRIQLETWAILVLGALVGLHWGLAGVAICTLPSFIYNAVRMFNLAGRILGTRWGSLWCELWPILGLNAMMAAALMAAHLALGPLDSPLAYLLAMIGVGAAVYGGAFLFMPLAALRNESARWRGLIRRALPPASPQADPMEKDQE